MPHDTAPQECARVIGFPSRAQVTGEIWIFGCDICLYEGDTQGEIATRVAQRLSKEGVDRELIGRVYRALIGMSLPMSESRMQRAILKVAGRTPK